MSEMNKQPNEQSTWSKSLRNSIVIHLLLLLIAFLFKMEHNADETIDTQYAVVVNFQNIEFNNSKSSNSTKSSAAEGRQRPKMESPKKLESSKPKTVEVPKVAQPKPTPTPPAPKPTPSDPVISETTTDVADIQAVENEELEVEEPEPEYIPEEVPDPAPAEEPVVLNPDVPNIEDIIGDISDDPIDIETEEVPAEAGKGSDPDVTENSSGTGSGDGDPSLKDGAEGGTGKGDTGSGKGNDAGGDDNDSGRGTGDHGEGEFDASGDGIFGRKVVYRDPSMVSVASAKSGKIVFKVCISRQGSVRNIEIDRAQTTITDNTVLRAALKSLSNYKYEPDMSAPREQCGNYTLKIDNYNGIGG